MPVSYDFHKIKVDSIKIDENRQRKKLEKVEDLAGSIARNGLLHPVVITRDGVLVSGERRLRAFQLLKLKEIPVHYLDELSPFEAKAIELEENLKRVDLTWKESCLATNEYHELRLGADKDWTRVATSEAIGLSQSQVGKILQVARSLLAGDKQVCAAESFTGAYNMVHRAQARVVKTEVSQMSFVGEIATKAPTTKPEPKESKISERILVADFIHWAHTYSGRRFNFVHCDFPYGIGYESSKYRGAAGWQKYPDAPEVYWALLGALTLNRDRIFFPSAHMLFWFSMNFYNETLAQLVATGFSVNPFPFIWGKDKGIIPDPLRGPRRVYETAFLCSLGDRQVLKSSPNLSNSPVRKNDHISTKPKEMLRKFFPMFVDELTEILDPTCGSGGALVVAKELGAKRVVGLDIQKDHVETTKLELNLARRTT